MPVYEFEKSQDHLIQGVVTPKLIAAWSRRRAWHGETVTIQIRSELIIDGTTVKLEVKSEDLKLTMDTFASETITGNKLDKDYKIDWASKKPKETPNTFVIVATITAPHLTATSAAMAVDLSMPVFSA